MHFAAGELVSEEVGHCDHRDGQALSVPTERNAEFMTRRTGGPNRSMDEDLCSGRCGRGTDRVSAGDSLEQVLLQGTRSDGQQLSLLTAQTAGWRLGSMTFGQNH